MHLQDGPHLDLSAQVSLVKAKTRPWKAIIALVLAIGAAAASGWAHNSFRRFLTAEDVPKQVMAFGLAVAFCALASAATIGLAGKARSVLDQAIGSSHAAIARYALLLIGAVTTLIVTLGLFGIPIGQLVLGGALTSVFVGIAAQQSLSNVFAGIMLMLARPFRIGDAVRMQAGALGGQISGTIVEVGITYVRLTTSAGMISIPNSQVLNAVVGPLPDPGAHDTQQAHPLMAQPPGQPSPAHPLMARRGVQESPRSAGEYDSRPEVPPGTPEPRPSGTPA